jgi:hypothetical protein
MAKQKTAEVELNGDFVRHEAAEAVRTFFRPIVGTYNFVVRASNPPIRDDHVVVTPHPKPKKPTR